MVVAKSTRASRMTLTLRALFLALTPASSIFAVILGPLVLMTKGIRLTKNRLMLAIVTIAANILGYLFSENFVLLRLSVLIAISYIVWEQLRAFRNPLILVNITEIVFYLHLLIIFMSHITGISFMEASENQVDGRHSGVFGYDYVSYFILSFLTVVWSLRLYNTLWYTFIAILGLYFILYSGRFGLLLLGLYLIFLATSLTLRQAGLLLIVGSLAVGYLLVDKITYMIETFQALASYSTLGDTAFVGLEYNADNSYAASPLVLLSEYNALFSNANWLLPSREHRLFDAGPPYIFINCGIILGLLNYYFMFRCFLANSLVKILLVLYLVILDLKFRSALSTFPMIWTMLMISMVSAVKDSREEVR